MTRPLPKNPEVKSALAAIRKEKFPQRYDKISDLAESSSSSTDTVLLHLLGDQSPGVRETAMEILAERNEVLGRIAARAALDDSSSLVRDRAATILGEIGNGLDVRRLTHTLQDSDWVVRATAADSLGSIGVTAALPILKKAMVKDAHPVVRRDAAFALSYSHQENVIPDLEQALPEEAEEQAKIGILSALYALGQRGRLPALLELLQSEDSTVRHAVINSLTDIVRPDDQNQAVQAIRDLVAHESNRGVRIDAEKAAEHLLGLC